MPRLKGTAGILSAAELKGRAETAIEIIELWRGERDFLLELATELTKDIEEMEIHRAELERQKHNRARAEAKAKRSRAARRRTVKKQVC